MKGFKKALVAVLSTLTLGVSALGAASCTVFMQPQGSLSSSSSQGSVWTMETVYAEAQELGYTGSLEEFIELVSGKDGVDGKDGVGIQGIEIDEKGCLVITFSNSMVVNLGRVVGEDGTNGKDGQDGAPGQDGKDGEDGLDGVSVVGASVNEDGRLILTLSNGQTIDCGVVKGTDGVNGEDGKDGEQGEQGLPGQDGEDGKDGQDGAPGKDGEDGVGVESVTINENGELIIKLTDGSENNLGKVVGENGKNGADGANGSNGQDGADGENGKDGENGQNGKDGQDGKDGVGIETIEINDDGEMVITLSNEVVLNLGKVVGKDGANGVDGSNGQDGANGEDGKDGDSVSEAKINENGELVLTFVSGKTITVGNVVGADGEDGKDGENGKDGQDGVGVQSVVINEQGELVVTLTSGTELNLGNVVGANGKDGVNGENGKDGVGIAKSEINANGELVLTYTNGNSVNLGKVVGANGTNGSNGADGEDGKDGVGIANVTLENGELVVTLTNNTVINLGNIKGQDGANGADGKDGDSVSEAKINENGELVLTFVSGKEIVVGNVVGADGKDGENGVNGENGKDGVGVQSVVINEKGELVVTLTSGTELNLGNVVGANGKDGVNGENGKDGVGIAKSEINQDGELILTYTNGNSINLGKVVGSNGTNGSNGADGEDGKDGVGIKNVTIDEDGNLSVSLTSGVTLNLGNIKGPQGDKGDNGIDGVSVVDAEINNDGELIFTLSNGEKINVGKIIGSNGINGSNGTNGVDGVGIKGIAFNANGELIITLTDNSTINCGKVPACSHSYSSWNTVSEANCTSMGVKIRSCSKCGFEDYDFVSSLGHSYKNTVVSATCTEKGYTLHECNKCDYEYRDTYTAKTAHSYGTWTEMLSTCTTKVLCQSCTVCGSSAIKSESGSWHNYTTSVIAPTCSEQGYTLHSCSNCGNSYKDSFVNATGTHTWQNLYVVSSTCAEKKTLVICTICNKTRVIDDIPTVEHIYTAVITPPTCIAEGYTSYTCETCGHNKIDSYVSPHGKHIYEDYVCTVCSKEMPAWDGTLATSFSSGSGTEEDPYLIASGEELAYMAELANSNHYYYYKAHYRLIDSINLNGYEWDPIGYFLRPENGLSKHEFRGCFDGNGFTVTNFKITVSSRDNQVAFGFFGAICDGTVMNLSIENYVIHVKTNNYIYAGGLVGNNQGNIINCYANGEIITESNKFICAGGLVGDNYDDISQCSSSGKISVNTTAGSLVGGMCGENWSGNIQDSCSDTIILVNVYGPEASYPDVGGLVGEIEGYSTINNCHASGTIDVTFTYSKANYATSADIGGFAGRVMQGDIYASSSNISIKAQIKTTVECDLDVKVGGFIGNANYNEVNISDCYSIGAVEVVDSDTSFQSSVYVGGFIGYNYDAIITNCYAITDLLVNSGDIRPCVGGFSGYNSKQTANCFSGGDIVIISTVEYATWITAGRFVGSGSESNHINVYCCEGQSVSVVHNEEAVELQLKQIGTQKTVESFNSSAFYIEELGWDADIWDFSNLDFENGKMPTLK